MPTPEELEALRKASKGSAQKAKELLDTEVENVMAAVARLDELKPKTADEETYKKLIKVIEQATSKNESIATLKARVKKLGDSAISLFKEMANIAKGLR